MGSSETVVPTNAEKTPPTVQAYYGPGMIPPAYFGTAIAPGHAPHPYMWAPQPILPPYGPPYAAMYPPGGVYPHPGMPFMVTPLNMTTQPNVAASKDKDLTGCAEQDGNGTTNVPTEADGNSISQSGYSSAEGSNGTDENNAAGDVKNQKKQRFEGTSSENAVGTLPSCPPPLAMVANAGFAKPIGTAIQPGNGSVVPHQYGVSSDLGTQNERVLKREKRKQSNRESARRSRLRKQAEIEELAMNVERLGAENANFRSEISRLTESSQKLRSENTALMEKLRFSQSIQAEEMVKGNDENHSAPSITENIVDDNNINSISLTTEFDICLKRP